MTRHIRLQRTQIHTHAHARTHARALIHTHTHTHTHTHAHTHPFPPPTHHNNHSLRGEGLKEKKVTCFMALSGFDDYIPKLPAEAGDFIPDGDGRQLMDLVRK